MFAKLIGGIISKVVGEDAGTRVVQYFAEKQQLKYELKLTRLEGKQAVERAKWEHRAEQLRQHGQWSQGMVQQMAGWKDEFVLILISIPLVTAAAWPEQTLQTFATLEAAPQWYRYMVVTIFLAIYGLKPALDKLGFWRNTH